MAITLTVTEGPNRGLNFTFAEHATFLVGRSPDAHFNIPAKDPYFSRLHFLVELNPPLCRIVDMKSRNGTFVNGARVKVADLKDGDAIQAGHTVLRVCLQAATDEHPRYLDAPPPPGKPAPSDGPDEEPTTLPPVAPSPVPRRPATQPDWPCVAGYQVLEELGHGRMGAVYQARRQADGGLVALKTIRPAVPPTERMVQRFLREAEILKGLEHPHIVAFRAMGHAGGQLWFAMDFVPGTDADRLVRQDGPLPVGRAVALTCQLLDALTYAHAKGFVHRDVKPSNLLVTNDGNREVVKLADFGLARAYQASRLSGLTLTGDPGGTPGFLPPEQILDFRRAKPPADQYGAAATLYFLLTAQPLYDGPQSLLDLMEKILTEEPVALAKRRVRVPEPLEAAILRALARKPEQRFANVATFRQALAPFAPEKSTSRRT